MPVVLFDRVTNDVFCDKVIIDDQLAAYNATEFFITNKYKNKVIILDNASSHRNIRVKELINKNNKLIYSVPYQHYTNSIEMFFSLLKSKLQKKQGLYYEDLNNNIKEVIKTIPEDYYKRILNGTYNRQKDYIKKNKVRKYKNYKD
jgi:hypothetical protein